MNNINIVRPEKDIKIGDKEYKMFFDMHSIATYRDISGKPFSMGVGKLFQEDDEEVMYFIASTLREKSNPEKPLGREALKGDVLQLLLMYKWDAIELVSMSLPSAEGQQEAETTKKK